MELKVFPSWSWICKLSKSRKYTGSVGTDGKRGCLSRYTISYAIWKDENEEGEKELRVSCKVQPPINSGETFETEEITYPFSEEHAEDAKNWINEQIAKFSPVIGE